MKITIDLSDVEVKGIKAYLKAVDGIKRPCKKDIEVEIRGIVSGALQSNRCAVSDYIAKAEKKAQTIVERNGYFYAIGKDEQ